MEEPELPGLLLLLVRAVPELVEPRTQLVAMVHLGYRMLGVAMEGIVPREVLVVREAYVLEPIILRAGEVQAISREEEVVERLSHSISYAKAGLAGVLVGMLQRHTRREPMRSGV
jgi:hypothetical protein